MLLGAEISDRYRLDRRLGAGGMSTVFVALDSVLEREVAVKLLAEHLAEDEAFVARFRREALAAAKLVHPNIVQVYDSGRDEATRRYFIVMEYVEGSSGADILKEHKQVSVRGGGRHLLTGVQRARLCAQQGSDPPRRQAREPAHELRSRHQARRLRHRKGCGGFQDHPARLGAGHRRIPLAGANPGG